MQSGLLAAIAAGFFGWQANENAKLAKTREAEAKQQEAAAREQADRATAHRLAAEGRLQSSAVKVFQWEDSQIF